MSIHEVFMPALSSTMTEGKIVSWVKSPGDKVEKGETVVVVESDKADMDVESFYEGFLAHIVVPAGETAPVGSAIALYRGNRSRNCQRQVSQPIRPCGYCYYFYAVTTTPTTIETPALATHNGSNHQEGRLVVSPRARKLAKEFKADLSTIKGSGPYGRIVAEDIQAFINPSKQTVAIPSHTHSSTSYNHTSYNQNK